MDGDGAAPSSSYQTRNRLSDLPGRFVERSQCAIFNSPMLVEVPCGNAEFGCIETFALRSEMSAHSEKCLFTRCHCPFICCDFIGSYLDISDHAISVHAEELVRFKCVEKLNICFESNQRLVLMEEGGRNRGELLVVQRFSEEEMTCFRVFCVAPKVPDMGNFTVELNVCALLARLTWITKYVFRVRCVPNGLAKDEKPGFFAVPRWMGSATDVVICIKRVDLDE